MIFNSNALGYHQRMLADSLLHVSAVDTISARDLEACDFSFEISHEIVFPYDDLNNVRPIAKRQKDYGFDPQMTLDRGAGRRTLFAARMGPDFVAYAAIVEHWSGMAEVAELAVDRRARGQGVARQLLRAVETRAYEQGFQLLRLETQASNPVACWLYKNAGYSLGGYDRFLYAGSQDDGDVALFWYRKLP